MAIADSVESTLNLSVLVKELHPETKHPIPIKIYREYQSLHDALRSHKFVNARHLRTDISVLTEMLEKQKNCHTKWITKQLQIADSFTRLGDIQLLIRTLQEGKLIY